MTDDDLEKYHRENFLDPHPERLPTHPDWSGEHPVPAAPVETEEEEA